MIYVDLDGVLVDLVGQLINEQVLAREPDTYDFEPHVMDYLCGRSPHWWANLPRTVECSAILETVHEAAVKHHAMRVAIATHAITPKAAAGKIAWCQNNVPGLEVIIIKHKYKLDKGGCVLIDDSENQVDSFSESILVPRPWNRNRGQDVMSYIEKGLHG